MSGKYSQIPIELRERDQWVCWKTVIGEDGKPKKVPLSAKTGLSVDVTNPEVWSSIEQAVRYTSGHKQVAGIGFAFSPDDGFCGIDFDGCLNPKTKRIDTEVQERIDYLSSYSEISQSGRGVHVIVKASLENLEGRRNGHVELYDRDRFFVFTGHRLKGAPRQVEQRQTEVEKLHAQIFSKNGNAHQLVKQSPGEQSATSDKALLARARMASPNFRRLHEGRWQGLYVSQSEGDLAYCNVLARLGCDAERIDRLYRRSGLMRGKWDSKRGSSSYGALQIEKALTAVEQEAETGETFGIAEARSADLTFDWIVEKFIEQGELVAICGDGGSGKSYSSLALGMSVAMGAPFLGWDVPRAQKVLMIDAEMGTRTVKRRLRDVAAGYNAPDDTPIRCCAGASFDLTGTGVKALKELVEHEHPALVVADPLIRFCGGADENDAGAMDAVMSGFRRIAERYHCAIIIVHHTNKEGGPRGSSAIKDAVDTMLVVERDDMILRFHAEKSRSLQIPSFSAETVFGEGTFRLDSAAAKPPRFNVGQAAIITELGKGPATARQVAKLSEVKNYENARKNLGKLRRSGVVRRVNSGGRGKEATWVLAE